MSQDAIEKFWTWVTELTVDSFAEFMKANIVGAIMFFAAVIWIPVSCFVNIRVNGKIVKFWLVHTLAVYSVFAVAQQQFDSSNIKIATAM